LVLTATPGELLSYLLPEPEFVEALVEMGRTDAGDAPGEPGPWQVEPLEVFT
jgi:hypothetical protein